MIYKEEIRNMYEEALKEPDRLVRTMRIALCLCLIEDKKLIEGLAKI